MKVLVVDDEVICLKLLSVVLSGRGYQVTAVAGGDRAWEVLTAADPPSVIVLDWRMPGVDGAELCRRIRARPELSHLYIVACSGGEELSTAVQAGADDLVAKPFDPQELDTRLRVGVKVAGLRQEVRRLRGLLPICPSCGRPRAAAGERPPAAEHPPEPGPPGADGSCADCGGHVASG